MDNTILNALLALFMLLSALGLGMLFYAFNKYYK
jgi:hypothetical protein